MWQWDDVTSFTLVWIKIASSTEKYTSRTVTSFTLVWIKIRPDH